MKLEDKVVVVTGGGDGIGRELVLQLLGRGSRVAAVDLRPEALEETAQLAGAGDRLSQHVANIADREAVHALPDAVIAHHGSVDGVINCAGVIQPFTPVNELEYEVIDRIIQVDLYGAIHMVKAFLPHLLERPEAHLVNVSSMGGFVPFPGQSMYGAAKAAVKLLTEGLYAELLETDVQVSVVMPGAVNTHIAEHSGVDGTEQQADQSSFKPLPAPDAARAILNGMEHDRLHILVGSDSKLMYAASRLAPKQAVRLITRLMRSMLEHHDEESV